MLKLTMKDHKQKPVVQNAINELTVEELKTPLKPEEEKDKEAGLLKPTKQKSKSKKKTKKGASEEIDSIKK